MKSIRQNWKRLACRAVLVLLVAGSCSYARDVSSDDERHSYWANIGVGGARVRGGLGEDDGGLAGGISFSYRMGGNLFSIRGIEASEFKLDLWRESGPSAKVWDIGVLYGRLARASAGFASLSAGISMVGFSNDYYSSQRVGIPIECQLFWTPGSVVGLGFYGFANVNSEKSFVGALFCLQLRQRR